MAYDLIAAVDLGSNSFRLQVGRVVGNQIYPLDSLKDSVRLAAGLTSDKKLDGPSQTRGLEALARFGERLRGLDPGAVRAVATNTLRVAKNAPQFLAQAEAALGFPIEVIAGREEARLIYLGVAHTLPNPKTQQLVVDIGGGSTEFIIGKNFRPRQLESLYMGCVSYSLKYFPDGKVTKSAMKQAELAARNELQTMVAEFSRGHWKEAVGSSGSARALAEILQLNAFSDAGITPDGLDRLRSAMIKAGDVARLDLAGLKSDRLPVLPGGLAIMSAALAELHIESMVVAEGSMRQGILYDLLGRVQRHDMRDVTVSQFMQRYHVDSKQSRRVANLALALYMRFTDGAEDVDEAAPHYIAWAAKLHEIGISVAYSGYHKHSAYIAENADMPGFSKMEQWRVATLVLAHRRSLKKIFTRDAEVIDWRMVMALRLAALIYRSRADVVLPAIVANAGNRVLRLDIDREWLANNPLTVTALHDEIEEWNAAGFKLDIKSLRELEAGVEAQAA